MTLYARTAKEPCVGTCLNGWRPLPAAALAKPVGDFTIVQHPEDGSRQWAWQGKPLYTSMQDVAPGDINGEGPSGWEPALARRNYMPAEVVLRSTDYGQTLTTPDGRTLYLKLSYVNSTSDLVSRHFGKPAGPEGCVAECLKTWVPLKAPEGAVEQDQWKVMTRADGTRQWTWRGFALYTFAGDGKAGDILGEGHWDVDEKNQAVFWEVANLTP
jgi:predicted lipoprotein with Yx(FWY)xxD motif